MKKINFFMLLICFLMGTASVQAQVCRSSIPFAIDISSAFTPEQFTAMKNFVLSPFLNQLFPIDIQPNLYGTFAFGANLYHTNNVSDITNFISSAEQELIADSYFVSAVDYLLSYNALNYSSLANLPQNLIVFTGGSLHDDYFETVKNDTEILTANGNTVIVVFARPNMNQTNYQRIPELKLVEWSNHAGTLLANIRKNMNCLGVTSTTRAISTTKTSSSISACKSHIPFAYDVSKSLTSDQFTFEEQLILNPFLSALFPKNIQPSYFGIFDTSAYFSKSRPKNVTEIVNFVNLYPQLTGKTGNLDVILKQLLARNIFSDNDGLPVNTVIFTGSELPTNKIQTIIDIVEHFTSSTNTLTIVLTKPNINEKNYQAVALVSSVVLVSYNQNKQHAIANIRQAMNCI